MTTITIKIDQRKKEAKALLEYLQNLPFVEVEIEKPRYNAKTEKAIQDAKKGIGLTKVESVEELFKKVGIDTEEDKPKKKDDCYDPEFVKMVLKSAKSKRGTVVNPDDVWGSLGLK